VFDITAAELETASGISVAGFAPGETIVINVTDISGNVLLKENPLGPSASTADQVIWNFEAPTIPGSHTITTQADWYGAMLAGDYNVVNPSDIDGFLYADTFNGGASNGAELHYYGFDGQLPSLAPEPSTWAMNACRLRRSRLPRLPPIAQAADRSVLTALKYCFPAKAAVLAAAFRFESSRQRARVRVGIGGGVKFA
jgi:hypothetical protein